MLCNSVLRSKISRSKGLTLIEMMIAVTLVLVIAGLIIPSGRHFLIQHRIIAQLNTMSGLLYLARHQAIYQRTTTVVCPTRDYSTCEGDWQLPRMVFTDDNFDGERNPEEPLLQATSATPSQYVLQGPRRRISFHATGVTASPATLRFCHQEFVSRYARSLTLSLQGRLRASRDADNDGIHETNSGKPIRCD